MSYSARAAQSHSEISTAAVHGTEQCAPPASTILAAPLLAAALVSRVSAARADEPATEPVVMRLPVAVTQRPITQPCLVLSPHLDFAAVHTATGTATYLDAGGAFGITDDVEVHAVYF